MGKYFKKSIKNLEKTLNKTLKKINTFSVYLNIEKIK